MQLDPLIDYGAEIAALRAQIAAANAASLTALATTLTSELAGRVAGLIPAPAAPYDSANDLVGARRWSSGGFYQMAPSVLRTSLTGYYSVDDYGAVGDGVTDDATAINAAIAAAGAAGAGLAFSPTKTYLVGATILVQAGGKVPKFIDGRGATIKAKASLGALPLCKVENPHTDVVSWWLANLTLDGNGVASKCLYVHGCQYATFDNIWCEKANGYGAHVQGEPGYGVYYTRFSHVNAGGTTYAEGNASTGFLIESVNNSAGFYVAADSFECCMAQFNKGHGWTIDYASPTLVGCDAEVNDLYGINIDHAVAVDVLGGYSENNHQMRATRADGTGDGTTDYSFNATANSTGVKVLAGRHIGIVNGTWSGAGMFYMPGKGTITPILDPTTGRFTSGGDLKSAGGLGLDGANPSAGTLNSAGSGGLFVFALAGTTIAALTANVFRTYKPIDVFNTGLLVYAGAGSPAGVVSAPIGSLYMRSDGGAATSLYVKESGAAGNTGWVAK